MGERYRLIETEGFLADLDQVLELVDLLVDTLDLSIYWVLRRRPGTGWFSDATGLWFMQRSFSQGYLVQFAYRIDQNSMTVELVGVRPVPRTRL